MKRREFIGLIGGAAIARPGVGCAQQPHPTGLASALAKAKRDYEKISRPSEAARSDYITRLVRMRDKAARLKTNDWRAIDTEIKRHPAPSNSDTKTLSSRLVGEWSSPRHDYLYRADGTWTMLPIEENITHGTWRIEGNQYSSTAATEPPETTQYTIILITKKDFVFTDQTNVFYEIRE